MNMIYAWYRFTHFNFVVECYSVREDRWGRLHLLLHLLFLILCFSSFFYIFIDCVRTVAAHCPSIWPVASRTVKQANTYTACAMCIKENMKYQNEAATQINVFDPFKTYTLPSFISFIYLMLLYYTSESIRSGYARIKC